MNEKLFNNLKKLLAISLTPMTEDQVPDPNLLKKHLRFMKDKGLNGENSMMIINGSTAEAHSLSTDERKKQLEAAVDELGGDFGVIVGCQHSDINCVVDFMKHARHTGAACAMIIPPYYYPVNNETIVDFYSRISDRCDMGIIIYNNPTASGIDIPVPIYCELIKNANIVGIKECTDNFAKMERAVADVGDDVVIISGHGIIYEPYSAIAGVHTFNSSEACFAPDYALKVWKARSAGNIAELKRLRDNLRPYFNFLAEVASTGGANAVISMIKYATGLAGSYMGPGKTPVCPLRSEQKQKTYDVLKTIGII